MSATNSKPILFYWHKTDERYWYMSNFAYTPFVVGEQRYFSSEQWLMEHKALLFGDKASRTKIMSISWLGPTEVEKWTDGDFKEWSRLMNFVKGTGRKVKNFDLGKWTEHAQNIMVEGLKHKFTQHKDLYADLCATKGRQIAEASINDAIWGIGIGATHPDAPFPNKWKGTNWLGKSLMEIRGEK
jgi:predicted NAD-dependent protein-ADP-ribosyltransferase YbiA (DUF1768 family)